MLMQANHAIDSQLHVAVAEQMDVRAIACFAIAMNQNQRRRLPTSSDRNWLLGVGIRYFFP
jgi:hypothetical protein